MIKALLFLLLISFCFLSAEDTVIYKVREGDTLEDIATEYQMTVDELIELNNLTEKKLPPLGTELKVRIKDLKDIKIEDEHIPDPSFLTRLKYLYFPYLGYVYYVQLGDNLDRIAKNFDISSNHIAALNNLKNKKIYLGQRLYLVPGFRYQSYSYGKPTGGSIINPAAMPPMPGIYYIKNPERRAFYGHHKVVQWVIDAIVRVAYYYPDSPPVVIGDLSLESGSTIARHKSHRNGLDIDIGYYMISYTNPKDFINATSGSLDPARNALLIMGLLDTRMIDKIFMDKSLHELIRSSLYQLNPSSKIMAEWNRCIRHWPNHKDHIHVRFKNPASLLETDESDEP